MLTQKEFSPSPGTRWGLECLLPWSYMVVQDVHRKRVSRQVWDVYGMFFCSVPQQGTRREHTQNSTSCGHFRFPHVSGVWVGVGVGHEHKATVHEAFLHGNPGYQPITNRSGPGNNRSCSRLHHIYKHYPCTSSCMQGAPTALAMH